MCFRTLLCKNEECGYVLGGTCATRNGHSLLHWAIIKAASVTVLSTRTGDRARKQKWRDMPFEVPELTSNDIKCYADMDLSRRLAAPL